MNSRMLLARPRTGRILQPVSWRKPIDLRQRLRLGHRDGERVAHLEHRNRYEALGLLLADQLEQRRVDQAVTKHDALDSSSLVQRIDEHAGGDDALLDEDFAEQLAGRFLVRQPRVSCSWFRMPCSTRISPMRTSLGGVLQRKLLTPVFTSSKYSNACDHPVRFEHLA